MKILATALLALCALSCSSASPEYVSDVADVLTCEGLAPSSGDELSGKPCAVQADCDTGTGCSVAECVKDDSPINPVDRCVITPSADGTPCTSGGVCLDQRCCR